MRDPDVFPPITPTFAAAIGYVAAHWSLVEEQQACIAYNLLSLTQLTGLAVTADLGAMQREKLIQTLLALVSKPELEDEWSALIIKTAELRLRRNDAIHSVWRVVGTGHQGYRVKAKERLSITFDPMPITELKDLSDQILALDSRLTKFANNVLISGAAKILTDPLLPLPQRPQAQALFPKPLTRIHTPKRERKLRRRSAQKMKARKEPGASDPTEP